MDAVLDSIPLFYIMLVVLFTMVTCLELLLEVLVIILRKLCHRHRHDLRIGNTAIIIHLTMRLAFPSSQPTADDDAGRY